MASGEFSDSTRQFLREQAGNLCSYPGCKVITTARSATSASGISDVGEACHISGRTATAKRYDEKMSNPQRAHSDNGVWLCRTHGKLIDSDEQRFTIPGLREMKETHLRAIERKQARAVRRLLNEHSEHKVEWDAPDKSSLSVETVLDAFADSGVSAVWHDESEVHLAAALLVELAWNATTHATAGAVTFFTTPHEVGIRYIEGSRPFGLDELESQKNSGGGWHQLKVWRSEYDARHMLNSYQTGPVRTWSLVTLNKSLAAPAPCVTRTSPGLPVEDAAATREIQRLIEDCSVIVILIDRPGSMSIDIRDAMTLTDRILDDGRRVLLSSPFAGNIVQFESWARRTRSDWQMTRKGARLLVASQRQARAEALPPS